MILGVSCYPKQNHKQRFLTDKPSKHSDLIFICFCIKLRRRQFGAIYPLENGWDKGGRLLLN
jgi:hypothetical protein